MGRAHELLLTAVIRLRLLMLGHVARLYCGGHRRSVPRLIGPLMAKDLLRVVDVRAKVLDPLDEPLASWQPGEPEPDFGSVAYRADARLEELPVKTVPCVRASTRARRRYGLGKAKNSDLQATHDLGVSEIYLYYAAHRPELIRFWRGEDCGYLLPQSNKRPDAVLVDRGVVLRALDFITDYGRERVEEFHRACAEDNIPYELW